MRRKKEEGGGGAIALAVSVLSDIPVRSIYGAVLSAAPAYPPRSGLVATLVGPPRNPIAPTHSPQPSPSHCCCISDVRLEPHQETPSRRASPSCNRQQQRLRVRPSPLHGSCTDAVLHEPQPKVCSAYFIFISSIFGNDMHMWTQCILRICRCQSNVYSIDGSSNFIQYQLYTVSIYNTNCTFPLLWLDIILCMSAIVLFIYICACRPSCHWFSCRFWKPHRAGEVLSKFCIDSFMFLFL